MNRKIVTAPESTQTCPECGSTFLALIDSHNVKLCTDCPTTIVWPLKDGQKSRYSDLRGGSKYKV